MIAPQPPRHGRRLRGLFYLALPISCPTSAWADETATSSTVLVADDLPSGYRAWKEGLADDGLTFAVNYTSEELTAISGGESSALVHAGQLSFTGQADMERLAGWHGANVTLSVSKRDGQGINTRSGINALLGPQEIFGRGNVTRISQFWLDQSLLGDRVSLRLGRGNPGSDFEEFDCNFINLSYCGNQVGNIVSDYWYNYPISQWGAIAKVRTGRTSYVKAGVYQVNPRNLGRDLLDPLSPSGGTGALFAGELGLTPSLGGSDTVNIKLGGWYSTASRADAYLDENRQSAAQTGSPFLQRTGSYGGYTSVVARFARGERGGPRNIMAFFNAALADTQTSTVDRSFALGAVYTGPFAARPQDQIGLAVSYNHLNRRTFAYRSELAPGAQGALSSTGENAVELFYGFHLASFLQFRPDLQWVRRPGGITGNPDAVIVGARTSVTF